MLKHIKKNNNKINAKSVPHIHAIQKQNSFAFINIFFFQTKLA